MLIDGPPAGVIALHDVFSTFVLRALSETHLTFFVTDGKPVWHEQDRIYEVRTNVDLAQAKPVGDPMRYFRYPPLLAAPQSFRISADRVLWLKWDRPTMQLSLVPERSAMKRVFQEMPSTFGQQLFPPAAIAQRKPPR